MKRCCIPIPFIFSFFIFHSFCFSQNAEIDSLLSLVKTDKSDTNKLIHLNKISWGYNTIASYDSAMFYANYGLQQSFLMLEKISNPKIKHTTQKCEAASYSTIGAIFFNQGNYPDALKNHLAALKIREAINDEHGKAASYNNIGIVYYAQGNYPDALKNQLAALKIRETIGDKNGEADSYNNIGIIYSNQGNYPEALKNHFAALKIREIIGDTEGMGDSYNNIGIVYYAQGNYSEALKNHFASLKIGESNGDRAGVACSYSNIGDVYTKQKKYKEAEEYLAKAITLAKEIGHKKYSRDAFSGLTELDSAKGNFKGAYENHKLYILYRDSIDNEETRKKTVQSQMTFDFEKKEAVANAEHEKELENQEALAEEKSRKQKIVLFMVSGFGFLVLLFAGFISRSLRVTRKQKSLIEEQKSLVEEKQKEILDSIQYARRIQRSLLPTEKYIGRTLKRLNKG